MVEGHLDHNAAGSVRKPRYQRARTPMVFTPLQVEQIRARLDPLSAGLVSLLAYAGPRPEEALRLIRPGSRSTTPPSCLRRWSSSLTEFREHDDALAYAEASERGGS